MQKLARAALAKIRKRLPNAIEIVYDSHNGLLFAFSPSDRPSDAILGIGLYPDYAALLFQQGAKLPDPHNRLRGSGNLVRNVRLDDAKVLDDPQVVALMHEALARAKVPMDPRQKRQVVIRAVAPTQRPRRPS